MYTGANAPRNIYNIFAVRQNGLGTLFYIADLPGITDTDIPGNPAMT